MIELRVAPTKLYPPCQTSFVCGRKSYTKMRLPYNPLYDVVKRMEIVPIDTYFDQVLEVLNGDRSHVSIFCAEDVTKLAYNYFQAELRIDSESVGNSLINAASVNGDMTPFDSLSDEVLCNGVINAQSKPVDRTKLEEAIEKYLNVSNRGSYGKQLVKSLAENITYYADKPTKAPESSIHPALQRNFKPVDQKPLVQSNILKEPTKKYQPKIESEAAKVEPPSASGAKRSRSKQTSPSPGKRSLDSRDNEEGKNFRRPRADDIEEEEQEEDSRRDGLSRYERKRWDEMMLLGLNGDFEENWRERNRPRKFEQRQPKEEIKENIEPKPQQSKVIYDLPIIFEYTKKGQTFDFSKLKFPVLINIQPENIDVLLEAKQLTITKNGKGFRRLTDYAYTKNGLYAEGLTLLLGGVTNIEDGGTVINGAKLEDITGDCSWIIIQNLVIYQK